MEGTEDEEESRGLNAEIIAELKEHVRRAEDASEQYRKQIEVLQRRLDDFTEQQTAAEEREYQRQSALDVLRAEVKETARQMREMEQVHENEVNALLQEREIQASREAQMQVVIHRLNETLRSRDATRSGTGRADENEISPIELQQSSNEGFVDEMFQEKNAIIEALRIELAEAHIKVAEMEHMGDGRLQELEKSLMDTKMQNARLREDNESFQYLLSEKTLKGDFLHDTRSAEETTGLSSLAEELETAADDDDGQNDIYKKMEAEIKTLREGNKALTLYIDKIIGRILQHEGFEHIIVDKDDTSEPPKPPSRPSITEKALPAIPDQQAAPASTPGPSLLQRAKSVVSRQPQPTTKTRPVSYMPASQPTANENPETAPSIPLNRGHRRARSDQAQNDMSAAALVQQMNRGSPLRTVSGGAMSPGIRPLSPPMNPTQPSSFQSGATPGRRTTSSGGTARDREHGSSANSIASEVSGEKDSTDASSVPTSTHAPANIPGAVMKQNQLRPLRLVQEQNDEQEEQRRKANRGSWIGWLKGANLEAQ